MTLPPLPSPAESADADMDRAPFALEPSKDASRSSIRAAAASTRSCGARRTSENVRAATARPVPLRARMPALRWVTRRRDAAGRCAGVSKDCHAASLATAGSGLKLTRRVMAPPGVIPGVLNALLGARTLLHPLMGARGFL